MVPVIFKNFGVKLAALLLAILLWFHVATEKTIQYNIDLELTNIDLTGDLLLTEPPAEPINVIVSAIGKRLLQSDWKEGGLRLSATRNITGRFKTELSLDNVSLIKSEGIDLVEIITPREITLNCDRKMEMEIPVKSNVQITPDEGYVLSKINTFLPNKVMVTGPRRFVMMIDSILTVSETYNGVRNDLKLNIPLVYPEYYGLTIEPDTVNYIVGVKPVRSKIFPAIPILIKNAPPDDTSGWNPGFVEIRVGGLPDLIDAISDADIEAFADFSNTDSLGQIPVEIILPSDIILLDQKPLNIKYSVQ